MNMNPSVPSVVKNPVQRSFCFDIRARRPLCSINAAMAMLNLREDPITDLIQEGHLEYAFNIATIGSRKREVRILMASINAYQNGFRALTYSHRPPDAAALNTILEGLFRHGRPHLRLSEIYDVLNCSSQHALDLWRGGEFGPSVKQQGGQRISPIADRSAVITFLKSRRLT